ncbi:MAG: HAMP domain-containing histidine kinase [Elainella sp. Prado103]|nr:HAMP domain-containing histidine kinase [Elainella sp. Prado103]
MFQATRRRLALWYMGVTAVLLLLFATGFYLYVRNTLVERIDDTLSHVVEIVERSLVTESQPAGAIDRTFLQSEPAPSPHINIDASFPGQVAAVEDDHIDLEWFSPTGEFLWSTFSEPLEIPLHPNSAGETVYTNIRSREESDRSSNYTTNDYPTNHGLRQITQRVEVNGQVVGYLRVSHPWFEVTKPSRQLIRDLSLGGVLILSAVGAIGWLLSGLAIAPVRDSYQRLKQFTADASHELRNPIAVIQTNVQVALADPDPTLQQDQLRLVERLTRRLGRLVDDLLFLARQDSGIAGRQLTLVKLDRLLQEVIEEQQAIAIEKDLDLKLEIVGNSVGSESEPDKQVPPLPVYGILGDPDQLTRLFTNLISNAVQYTPAGSITVRLQRTRSPNSPVLQVQIQDTGIGIPAEALPHLFDRFYRVDPARTSLGQPKQSDRSAGSGLGLAIAKVITENHQGQIHVSSIPHQGTTFTVILPYSKHAASAHPSGSNASNQHGK